MGGSSGGGRALGDTSQLEQKAKEILRQGETGRKNVFISFAYEDLNDVNLLRGQARNDNSPIEFNDHSVTEPYDSERAEYIKVRLRERLERCSTTVVYLSPFTPSSDWVRWEVEKSVELGKKVIAVHSGILPPPTLPDWIAANKIKVVSWSQLSDELSP